MSWSKLTTMRKPVRGGPKPPAPRLLALWNPSGEAAQPADVLTPGARIVAGREVEGRDVLLPDRLASRRHARFEVDSDGIAVRIVDTSTNGTLLNGVPIDGEATLEDGDVLRMGDTFLLLRYVPAKLEDANVDDILGTAPSVCALRHTIATVADSDATVLVLGESGTGKELVSRALHELSGRRGKLVAVNSGAIPAALAESQLFGHAKGAFTGADRDREGFFRAADGGTLQLDEIGELSLEVQAKLLRVLEDRAVTPVGTTAPVPCDVRLVAATHRDLDQQVKDGTFRGDLLARLAEITIRTPPLRERREDILPLLRLELGDEAPPLDADLVEALLTWRWPYNVRELLKVGKELRIRGKGHDKLELDLVRERLTGSDPDQTQPATEVPSRPPRPTRRERPARRPPPSKDELEAIAREHRGNVSAISRATGRSRKQVYRWCEEMGIELADYRD